ELVDCDNSCPVELSGTKAALITLLRCALRPWTAEKVVIAASEGSGKLAVQEKRYIRLDPARSDRVVWDQSSDGGFNEGGLHRCKIYIPRSGRARRGIGC